MTVWTESLCSFPSLIKFCFVSVYFYLTQFFNSAPFNPLSYTHACLPDSNFVCLYVHLFLVLYTISVIYLSVCPCTKFYIVSYDNLSTYYLFVFLLCYIVRFLFAVLSLSVRFSSLPICFNFCQFVCLTCFLSLSTVPKTLKMN
jgi:hypothetical protein